MTDRLLICAPMGIEARAIRRGLRAARSQRSASPPRGAAYRLWHRPGS